MRRMFLLVLALCMVSMIDGRTQTFEEFAKQQKESFNKFVEDDRAKFKEFRDKMNSEFEDFMRGEWTEATPEPAEPTPTRPEPPLPVVKDPQSKPSIDPIAFDVDIARPAEVPIKLPKPIVPIPKPEVPITGKFEFDYYGSKCYVSLENKHKYTLKGINENNVADGWSILSKEDYNSMINDCLEWRDELNLCDWGYFKLVEKMAVGFFGAERVNEARLMQLYVLIQSGYKVRMARAGETLVVLIPSSDNISEYLYLKVNGINYYAIDKSVMGKSFRLFDREFPQEQAFSLRSIGGRPNLSISSEYTKTNKFRIPGADEDTDDIEVSINKHLMDFYNDFPRCNNIDNYAVRSLSEDVKEQLYPQLREMIKDMNQTQSVNMLLSFVQKSFRYKIDEEQFGRERPLFADETLFYPYCDCEDRSVLFSVLVKDLIGLDVVLLNYPNHLATAVLFDSEVEGDFLMLDNKRYIVCDPTYIGASIGQAMPNFKKTTAKVIKI